MRMVLLLILLQKSWRVAQIPEAMVQQSVGRKALQRRDVLRACAASSLSLVAQRVVAQAPTALDQDQDVPYVVTPQAVVDAMLEMAQLKPGDRLIDLGCGDGRIVRTAARRYRVLGLGVDLDPSLVRRAQQLAHDEGLQAYCRFEVRDLFDTDLNHAEVITLYLLPAVNLALRPRLKALKPGTRILSHDWDMGDWLPQETRMVLAPDKPVGFEKRSKVLKWIIS
jgi:SAM-dependent methyltransferase